MLAHFKEQFAQIGSPDLLRAFRNKAWSQFEALGLPTKKEEAYRYVPLRELYQRPLALAKPAEVSAEVASFAVGHRLVFINGFFSPELSDFSALPKQVEIIPFSIALRSYASFLNQRTGKALAEEKDPFAALNAAVHGEGVFIYVPPKLVLKEPIQCVHIHTDEESLSSPRIHLVLGKGAQVDWIATAAGRPGHLNAVLDIALEEGAQLRCSSQISPAEGKWHFEAVRATLKQHSRLHSVSLSYGSGCARQDYRVVLAGQGAEAQLLGLTCLKGKAQGHAHLVVEHAAPHTQSMQRFKTLLDETSQSSFEGKILVRKEAQKTQAYQLNNNLLLDDRAIANSKPNLEIFADDVKASHGVTVAQLDAALLFYLQSRGIPEMEAKRLLTAGFCQEIFDAVSHPFLAQEIQMQLNHSSN